MTLKYSVCTLAFLLLVFTVTGVAEARKGVLKRADEIAFRTDVPVETKKQVKIAFTQPGIEFLEGHWVNSISNMKFSGNAKTLSKLMHDLSTCDDITIKIGFQELDATTDWHVIHFAGASHFSVIVNSQSKNIQLNELSIPEMRCSKPADGQRSTEQKNAPESRSGAY